MMPWCLISPCNLDKGHQQHLMTLIEHLCLEIRLLREYLEHTYYQWYQAFERLGQSINYSLHRLKPDLEGLARPSCYHPPSR